MIRYGLTLLLTILLVACQEESTPPQVPVKAEPTAQVDSPDATASSATSAVAEAGKTTGAEQPPAENTPPQPPVLEDFQGQPKLSLFPRVGDYQPEIDSDRHPYWRTFIDHLVKVTGVVENQEDGRRGWVFRSIDTIDSLGYFAPLAVEPGRSYQVSFDLTAELPEGASAGIGILEFNEFLWVGEQYPEALFNEHYRGSQEGKRLTGKLSGSQTFTFTTGPDTRMIHLVLFREGTHDRNSLMFDNIHIE